MAAAMRCWHDARSQGRNCLEANDGQSRGEFQLTLVLL